MADEKLTMDQKREMKLNELVARQEVVDKAEEVMRISEADFRGKKKEHEKLVEQQQAFIRQLKQGEAPNLFDQEGMPPIKPTAAEIKAAEKKMQQGAATVAAGQNPAAVPAEADAWKAVSIDKLGLAAGVVDKLKNHQVNGKSANLDTLGGIAAFTSAEKKFTDIPGIGQSAADKISDALAKYFENNPQQAEAANQPEGEAEGEGGEEEGEGEKKPAGKKKAKAKKK